MKIAICDDEPRVLSSVSDFIHHTWRDLDLLTDVYASAEALLEAVQSRGQRYDLLLLDIEMKGLDGIQTARQIRELLSDLYIVFITSHEEFSLTGYEVSAFRFLVKPIQESKLREAIEAVRRELLQQQTILVQKGGEETLVRVKDILYLEARNQDVRIVLSDRELLHRSTIEAYETLLASNDFFRVHRSYLVNLKCITFVSRTELRLSNGDRIPVSRLRNAAFLSAFQSCIRRTLR